MSWFHRIELARREGGFSDIDKRDAADWVTCACGEQDPRIPRHHAAGAPQDNHLWALGCNFHHAVQGNEYDSALDILRRIEVRAAQVLAGVE